MARRKGDGRQGHGRDSDAPRTQEGRTDERRRWNGPECKNALRNQGSRQELCLRKEKAELKAVTTSGKQNNTQRDLQDDRRAGGREANSRVFCQDAENDIRTLWWIGPLRNKRRACYNFRVRTIDVRASIILGTSAPPSEKRVNGEKS
jgi:hypothetical protein